LFGIIPKINEQKQKKGAYMSNNYKTLIIDGKKYIIFDPLQCQASIKQYHKKQGQKYAQ
jgi:hypothetical protein